MHVNMGKLLPALAVSKHITSDTQFMFQFYKPAIQYYAPSPQLSAIMSRDRLQSSLATALHGCPLLLGRFCVHSDSTVSIDYDPDNSNPPTLEFQDVLSVSYSAIKSRGFSYSLAKQHGIDMDVPSGIISKTFDKPMLMIKVSYLADGGLALFTMTNHVVFDGNAMFNFISHWARCHKSGPGSVAIPLDLETHSTFPNTINMHSALPPAEICADASKTPAGIATDISKPVVGENMRACVFEISTASIAHLKQQVVDSGVLHEGEWVSSNNVLAAFVVQCVAQANTNSRVYEAGDWTVFQTMDMRRALGLPLRGLGSPLILAECQVVAGEVMDNDQFPVLARRVRQNLGKYSPEYLQATMRWVNAEYGRMAACGTKEPWRHFWFPGLDTNHRTVGVSCMNRIPVYDADFGAGRPTMTRSINPRPNYIIVFPGPPASAKGPSSEYSSLHLYVTLERPAMDALCADAAWNQRCELIGD